MLSKLTYNGHGSDEFGIRIEKMPALNRPARKYQVASVPGRNGNIYELEDAWEEIIQPYEIFAGNSSAGSAVSSFTNIMEWLHSADGYAVLSDTYDTTHYRMAVFVDSTDIESMWHTWGRAVINFRCRPERYLTGQTSAVASGAVINNTTKHIAKPVITLTGGGMTNLLKLDNRTKTTATYSYSTTGVADLVPYKDTRAWICNATLTMIYLANKDGGNIVLLDDATGELQYSCSDSLAKALGFLFEVSPETDYTLSWEANAEETVAVFYCEQGGFNKIIKRQAKTPVFHSGWAAASMVLSTPSTCGYIFIAFGRFSSTIPSFRKIMLNRGTTAQTFRAYATPTTSTLRINDTSMSINSAGFNTAIINCDKEDVTIDGANGNQSATLKDQYGNISEEYLQLVKGNNTITYSGDITACSIDTKMWNL